MSPPQPIDRFWNRRVLFVFLLELLLWGIWSQTVARVPFESFLVEPVIEGSLLVGQVLFGCRALACIPFVFAGFVVYLYAIAVVVTNGYDELKSRELRTPA